MLSSGFNWIKTGTDDEVDKNDSIEKMIDEAKNDLESQIYSVRNLVDKNFYEFSLESYKSSGYKILSECTDLKNNPVEGDVETEHERLFKSQGKNIFRIVAEV